MPAHGPAEEPDHVEAELVGVVGQLVEVAVRPEDLLVLLLEDHEQPAVHLLRPRGESVRLPHGVVPRAVLPRRHVPVARVARERHGGQRPRLARPEEDRMHGRDRRRVTRRTVAAYEAFGARDGVEHHHRRAGLPVVQRHPGHGELAAGVVGRLVAELAVAHGLPAGRTFGAGRRREARDAPPEAVRHVQARPRLVDGKALEDRPLESRHSALALVRHAARHGPAIGRLHGVQRHVDVRTRRGARRFRHASVRLLHREPPRERGGLRQTARGTRREYHGNRPSFHILLPFFGVHHPRGARPYHTTFRPPL